MTTTDAARERLAYFIDLEPHTDDFLSDALTGLAASPKGMSPKYFYDKLGSEIFDDICRSQDYYVTRTEMSMLESVCADVAKLIGPGACVVEFGSGSSWKIRTLLSALETPSGYLALDISRDHLIEAAAEIAGAYPEVRVGAVCADFTEPFELPRDTVIGEGRKLGFLPGSTIGNFTPEHAKAFLTRARALLAPEGALFIGIDLKKDAEVLRRAYNDSEGHTARFNLNLLTRMSRELGAQIEPDAFTHEARWNADKGRIEMHLVASRPTTIRLEGKTFSFDEGETIHTENSHKYTVEEFRDLGRAAGFKPVQSWVDPENLFSLHYFATE